MAFSDYTNPDDVRSVLGVSDKEIEDGAINNNVYLTGILESLYRIAPTLQADYLATMAVAPRSPAQNRFILLVSTFCSYTVALQLIPSIPMSAPKDITDGKSAQGRIDNPYALLKPAIIGSLSYFKDGMKQAYKAVFPNAILGDKLARIDIISVGLGFDPVTGV